MEILGIFEIFFLLWFPLEKCLLVQSAFSAALMGWKIFEKKMDFGFEIFHIFFCQKTTFFFLFRFLDPPYFRAGGRIYFFRHFTKFFAPEKKSGSPPPFRWTCKFPHFWNVTLPYVEFILSDLERSNFDRFWPKSFFP